MSTFVTVVAPLYNEQESVELLYDAIVSGVSGLQQQFEIVFVDDGSRDQTFSIAKDIAKRDRRLRVIKFRRNYGQTPAMVAGIEAARGDVIVTMDGDLQNDPADIPLFLKKLEEGYDIVVGWRYQRQDKLITRKIPSRIANWLIGKVTGVPIKDNGCSFKAYKRDVIQQVPLYSEMHRFIPAMTSLSGARIAEIKVRHHARQFGESKYGLSRIYKVLMDLLTIKTLVTFGTRPLRWFSMLALFPAILGISGVAYALMRGVTVGDIPISIGGSGVLWASLSIFLIMTGALCELIYVSGDMDLPRLARLSTAVGSGDSKLVDSEEEV